MVKVYYQISNSGTLKFGPQWEKPGLLLCVAEWCGYCQQLKRELEKLDDEILQAFVFMSLEETDAMAKPLLEQLGVNGFPTIFFIRENGIVEKVAYEGERSAVALRDALLDKFVIH